ncbi:MAG: hypothetical protein ABL956_06850 [Hyphomonadaceae bacterium]
MKDAKFEHVPQVSWEPAPPPVDRDDILAALIERADLQSRVIVRLMWAVMILGILVVVPMVNQHVLPLLRGQ